MSTWHQPGQGTLCSLLSHAAHHQPGKTPGPGVTVRAVPWRSTHPSAGREGSWEQSWGAQPLSRRSQGMLAACFPSVWH